MNTDRASSLAMRAAVDTFRELGWHLASIDDAATLPIGTEQQQAVVLKAMRNGARTDFHESWDAADAEPQGSEPSDAVTRFTTRLGEAATRALQGLRDGMQREANSSRTRARATFYRQRDAWEMMSLLAVRVGVSALRSATLLTGFSGRFPAHVTADVVATRGAEFAEEFVRKGIDESRWLGVDSAALRILVARFDLPIPRNVPYAAAWCSSAALDLRLRTPRDNRGAPEPGASEHRFAEHVETAIELAITPSDLPAVMAEGARLGRLDRQHAVNLALSALDAASKPTARTAWANSLVDTFALTDAEFLDHGEILIQAMAMGPATIVDRFAPPLIAVTDDDQLADVLLVALTAPTKKAQRSALNAAAARIAPAPGVIAAVTDLLGDLASSPDRAIAKAAQAVLDVWGATPDRATEEAPPARGLWRPAPPVWKVPRLELPAATPDAVLDALGVLLRKHHVGPEAERFLALAQRMAYADPPLARETLSSLAGLQVGGTPWLAQMWLAGEREKVAAHDEPRLARIFQVSRRFDSLPCLLSTPTFVDLRIAPSDLVGRLATYADADFPAYDGDLWLALTRLDVSLASADDRRALTGMRVDIRPTGPGLRGLDAAQVTLAYLDDPIIEPATADDPIVVPRSLSALPNRLIENEYWVRLREATLFPTWSLPTHELDFDLHSDAGMRFRHLARRASPFPPSLANRLLEAQHASTPGALPDARTALVEAWHRGLLPPDTIDVGANPRALAAKAAVLLDVAEDGLASFAWEVLDALTSAASEARTVPAGTLDVIEAQRCLLAEAQAAVASGIAAPDILALPGVRRLAERSGSGKAVTAARGLARTLPPMAV